MIFRRKRRAGRVQAGGTWLPADAEEREAKARSQADKAWTRLRKVAPWWHAPQE